MTPSDLAVRDLVKRFPGGSRNRPAIVAVDGLSLDVEQGQLLTLLGPSGCGKTTTLRCIAGLETPDAGHVAVGERVVFSSAERVDVPANRRRLGMVFQSYGIWPHMDVFENVAFPLRATARRQRPPSREIAQRVERVLAVVQLDELAGRPATDLSGGQQQRLALARALVTEPPVLLLDEPLSNLDARLRDEMRLELKRLQHEVGVTTVMVTHDQVEALGVSSMIAVMRQGRVEQVGTPEAVYAAPASRFVAEFIGGANVLDAVVERADGTTALVKTAEGPLHALAPGGAQPGETVQVIIRPERVEIEAGTAAGAAGAQIAGRWAGVVQATAYLGECVDHVVMVGSTRMRVRADARQAHAVGNEVVLTLPPDACVVLPAAT